MTLRELVDAHPDWMDCRMVINVDGDEYDYVDDADEIILLGAHERQCG